MSRKFIEIKKNNSSNYLNSGYFVVTNTSNDWLHVTTDLYYVRPDAVMAVDELDVSLEKQESKGLVTIQRPTPTIVTESPIVDTLEESPTASNKKVKKSSKIVEETVVAEQLVSIAVNHEEQETEVDVEETEIEELPASTDTADENKDVEVQEIA
jgi:hypothetical protein